MRGRLGAMSAPLLHRYQTSERSELLDFVREVYSPDDSARIVTQWPWRYERNPFTPEDGPSVWLLRIGTQLVGLAAGYRFNMWMGGTECIGECRGTWIVHPDYRGQNLWQRITSPPDDPPIMIGWSRLPPRVSMGVNWFTNPVRPLVRILDAGRLTAHFSGNRALGSIGSAASTTARSVMRHFRRTSQHTVAHLDRFDQRADALWLRTRRSEAAMIVRDHRYLNWRYRERPDADYTLYGVERGAELDGFLVTRTGTFLGMSWGYLVDFLAPEDSPNVLMALVKAALDEFRRLGVAAVTCYATDAASRRALVRCGFFPAPQKTPIRFVHLIRKDRSDLERFKTAAPWYLTMGDGDLEMAP